VRLFLPVLAALAAILAASAAGSSATIGHQIHVGVAPSVLTFSKDGRYAYVMDSDLDAHHSGRGSLVVVSRKHRKVVRKVRVQLNPQAVSQSADGSKIFAANYGSDTVSVISRKSWRVMRTIHVGRSPGALVDMQIRGREYLVVVNSGKIEPPQGSLMFLRVKTMRKVKTLKVPFNPVDAVRGPGNKVLYVANGNRPTVVVVNTRTMKVSGRIHVRDPIGALNALAINGKRTLLYVVGGASTSVVSTKNRHVLAHFNEDPPGNPIRATVAPNGIALILNGPAQNPEPGSLTVLRGTKHIKVVDGLGVFPIDVKVTANGRRTWVTNNQAGTVSVFRTPR
jgi:YVTN family beta-propeller protein